MIQTITALCLCYLIGVGNAFAAEAAAGSSVTSIDSVKKQYEKLKLIRLLPGQSAALVIGIPLGQMDHPLVGELMRSYHQKQKLTVYFLDERQNLHWTREYPGISPHKQRWIENHFFYFDFNSIQFQYFCQALSGIYKSPAIQELAKGVKPHLFDKVYFDWSTFKFAKQGSLKNIYTLLPQGGKMIVAKPLTQLFESLEPGETRAQYNALSYTEKYKRNLDKIVTGLREAGFHVQITKRSDPGLTDDVIFNMIAQYTYNMDNSMDWKKNPPEIKIKKELPDPNFDVIIATKP